jgi:hypothetical protein
MGISIDLPSLDKEPNIYGFYHNYYRTDKEGSQWGMKESEKRKK